MIFSQPSSSSSHPPSLAPQKLPNPTSPRHHFPHPSQPLTTQWSRTSDPTTNPKKAYNNDEITITIQHQQYHFHYTYYCSDLWAISPFNHSISRPCPMWGMKLIPLLFNPSEQLRAYTVDFFLLFCSLDRVAIIAPCQIKDVFMSHHCGSWILIMSNVRVWDKRLWSNTTSWYVLDFALPYFRRYYWPPLSPSLMIIDQSLVTVEKFL